MVMIAEKWEGDNSILAPGYKLMAGPQRMSVCSLVAALYAFILLGNSPAPQ